MHEMLIILTDVRDVWLSVCLPWGLSRRCHVHGCRMTCVRGHSVQLLSNYFDHLLEVMIKQFLCWQNFCRLLSNRLKSMDLYSREIELLCLVTLDILQRLPRWDEWLYSGAPEAVFIQAWQRISRKWYLHVRYVQHTSHWVRTSHWCHTLPQTVGVCRSWYIHTSWPRLFAEQLDTLKMVASPATIELTGLLRPRTTSTNCCDDGSTSAGMMRASYRRPLKSLWCLLTNWLKSMGERAADASSLSITLFADWLTHSSVYLLCTLFAFKTSCIY